MVDHNNPQSRNEEILIATIDGKEYNKLPQSRIEELLLELKETIEEGRGGGGTTNYENLSNQPQVNGETLIGDKTGADLGLVDAEEGKGLSTNDYDDTEKAAVAAATSALSAIKDGTEIDSFGDVEVALLDKADVSDLGTAAAKDSTNAVTSGSTDLVESGAVKDAIDAAVAAAYHHAGTKTVAQLTHDLLIAANEGNVYNITDSGTTTSDFIEGIGKTIDEGSNVGICKVGNTYMFDLLSGFLDTTNFVQKLSTAGLLKNDGTVNTTIEDTVAGHTAAIATKQPITDNSLQTTDKTVVGAVNELKSGLTNVNTALSVPEGTGKNIFDKDNIDSIKKYYDGANWINQSSNQWKTIFIPVIAGRTYTSSGFPHTAGADSVFVKADKSTVLLTLASANNNSTFVVPDMTEYVGFAIWSPDEDYTSAQLELGSTATAYAPYIPSVESRIEAVESGLTSFKTLFVSATTGDYRDKFNSMYSTISALNFHDRVKSFINFTGTICNYCDMTGGAYIYIGSYYSGKLTKIIVTVDPQYSGTMKMEIDETAVTKTDLHTTEDNNKFTLYM